MASFASVGPSFEKDTPILRLTLARTPNAKWVLWPVFAWRVVPRCRGDRKLNLFQQAGARARPRGCRAPRRRGRLPPDRTRPRGLVVLELQNMGLVDHAGALTVRGLKMLDDIEDDRPMKHASARPVRSVLRQALAALSLGGPPRGRRRAQRGRVASPAQRSVGDRVEGPHVQRAPRRSGRGRHGPPQPPRGAASRAASPPPAPLR